MSKRGPSGHSANLTQARRVNTFTLVRRCWRPHSLWRLRAHGVFRHVRTSPPEERMHSLFLPFAGRGASHLAGPGSSGLHTPLRHQETREAARAGGPGQGRALGRAPRRTHRGRAARSPWSRRPHGGGSTGDGETALGGGSGTGCGLCYSYTEAPASQVVLAVKNPPANAGDERDAVSIPGSGRSPGGGHSIPLQYSCLENPMKRGAWRATVPGVTKSRTGRK